MDTSQKLYSVLYYSKSGSGFVYENITGPVSHALATKIWNQKTDYGQKYASLNAGSNFYYKVCQVSTKGQDMKVIFSRQEVEQALTEKVQNTFKDVKIESIMPVFFEDRELDSYEVEVETIKSQFKAKHSIRGH